MVSWLQGTINRILPLVIMGSFSCLGGITALFLPETLWRHLPNTLEEGEGFGSMDWRHLLHCPQKRWVYCSAADDPSVSQSVSQVVLKLRKEKSAIGKVQTSIPPE